MVHSINANNNPKLSKFVLYFQLSSVHAHIILWINGIDVDHITNEIVAMVPATIDEQSGKFILPDNEHDLTLFKLVERKQMHQCGPRCKTNKHIGTCKYRFPTTIFAEQHATQHPIIQRWVNKIKSSVIFELISRYYHFYIYAIINLYY
jgi:hypothetical protein